MIFAIISYILTTIFVSFFIARKKIRFKQYPKLIVTNNGIEFVSAKTHRISINNCKWLQLENRIYIKQNNKILIIDNIVNAVPDSGYLYFKGNGKVTFRLKTENYRYFNLIIKLPNINFVELKQKAILDMLYNWSNLNKAKLFNKYLHFIKEVLGINLNNFKLEIKPNKYKLNFSVIYRVNNIIKRINVN